MEEDSGSTFTAYTLMHSIYMLHALYLYAAYTLMHIHTLCMNNITLLFISYIFTLNFEF